MRLDQLPRSDNVEDRRGTGSGSGGSRMPGGRSGLGIIAIILLGLLGWWLGIDPGLLMRGGDILTGGGRSQQQEQQQPPKRDSTAEADGSHGPDEGTGVRRAGKHGGGVGETVPAIGRTLRAADAGDVFRAHAVRLRIRAIRDGSVLLSAGSQGLSRYLLLSGSRAPLPRVRRRQQGLPVLTGLRDHP